MAKMKVLTVNIEKDELVIRIGGGIIAHAVTHSDYWPEGYKIADKKLFLTELVDQLLREDEDGTTAVHVMLDKASLELIESGAQSIDQVKAA